LVAEPGFPPAVGGLFRPYLLIPADLLSREDGPAALRFILLHELAHLRTGDLLVNWISLALRAVHWFNPAIWFAFARMSADRELACDAYVLSQTKPTEHESYGHLLIDVIERLNGRRPSPVTVGMSDAPALLQTRIRFIRSYNRPRVWQSLLAIAVASILGLCGLTSAQSEPGKEQGAKNRAAQKSTGPSQSVASALPQAKGSNPSHTITLNVACVAEDGSPVAEAEVVVYAIDPWTLEANGALTKRTAGDGTCRFDETPVASNALCRALRRQNQICIIAVKAAGRASAIRSVSSKNVTSGAATIALFMPAAQTVVGRVTDATGKPVWGASISWTPFPRERPVPGLSTSKTDEGGLYVLADVPPLSAPAEAERAGLLADRRSRPAGPLETHIPTPLFLDVSHPKYGGTRVACYHVPGLVNVRLPEAGFITGRVVDGTTKQPLAGVSIFVGVSNPMKSKSFNRGTTDANGAYRLAAAAGNEYTLSAYKDGFYQTETHARWPPLSAKVTTSVSDVEMVRAAEIRGRLVDRATKQPVHLKASAEIHYVYHSARDAPWRSEPFATPIGRDGRFEQPALRPGRIYSLSVKSADPAIKIQSNVLEVSLAPGEIAERNLPVKVGGTP
jgi:hypothetical protein